MCENSLPEHNSHLIVESFGMFLLYRGTIILANFVSVFPGFEHCSGDQNNRSSFGSLFKVLWDRTRKEELAGVSGIVYLSEHWSRMFITSWIAYWSSDKEKENKSWGLFLKSYYNVSHWRHLISIRLVQPAVQDSTNQETIIFLGSQTRKLKTTFPIPAHTQGSRRNGVKAFILQLGAFFFLLATKTLEYTVSSGCRESRNQTLDSSPSSWGGDSFLILAFNSLTWSCI